MAPREIFTTSIDDIVNDSSIDIVVECMGGVEPARSFILAALNSGKTVVTSNKEVFSKHWHELEDAAKAHGAGLYHEATVGGGIPIIRTITDSMQANNITEIMGIINGTTNFILTKMSEENLSFEEVLKEAQRLGYAEANPAADVEGWDATYKLSILASMAFHTHVPIDRIYREGITKITPEDIKMAKRLGYEIKLLAIGKKDEDRNVEVRVHPTMIPKDHPLASVRGSFNAVFLKKILDFLDSGSVVFIGALQQQIPYQKRFVFLAWSFAALVVVLN
jgi:homoserine dehydrogenase